VEQEGKVKKVGQVGQVGQVGKEIPVVL